MVKWSKSCWEQLETIAFNAYEYTGFYSSALNAIDEAMKIRDLVNSNLNIGNKIKNTMLHTYTQHQEAH